MELHMNKRTYIVTGASSGLGRATADALMGEGSQVVALARRAEILESWRRHAGEQLAVLPGDLTRDTIAQQATRAALDTFGGLDGAFISVGGPPPGAVLAAADDTWRDAFESVFLPVLRVARTVVEAATNPPVIAVVLSSSVKTPLPGMAISNALRPGLGMLVKQLADELGASGGRVVGLAPGWIDTDRVHQLFETSGDPATARQHREATIPLGRLGQPEEFAQVATFVMSPAASYLSGCVIPVDVGFSRAL